MATWVNTANGVKTIVGMAVGTVVFIGTPAGWIGGTTAMVIGGVKIFADGLFFTVDKMIDEQINLALSEGEPATAAKLQQFAYFADWGAVPGHYVHVNTPMPYPKLIINSGTGSQLGLATDSTAGAGLLGADLYNLRNIAVGEQMVGGWQGTTVLRNMSLGIGKKNQSQVSLKGESLSPIVNYIWDEIYLNP